MKTITVEQTSRLLNDLNISFSEGAVKSLIQRQKLNAIPCAYEERRNSKYNFSIGVEQLVVLLIEKGFTDGEIKDVLLMVTSILDSQICGSFFCN
jgi:hypothetical protein